METKKDDGFTCGPETRKRCSSCEEDPPAREWIAEGRHHSGMPKRVTCPRCGAQYRCVEQPEWAREQYRELAPYFRRVR